MPSIGTPIDLTHSISAKTPVWPGSMRFRNTVLTSYDGGYQEETYEMPAGMGTHMDAPTHFCENGKSIHELGLDRLIAPLCVINVTEQVKKNPDHIISLKDIKAWENSHGPIPENSVVIGFTGWSQFWPNEAKYRNMNESGIMHFPGFGIDAAKYFVQRKISGLGIDTLGIDAGIASTFPVHHITLFNDIYHLENLTNLKLLPPTGATILALPMKIQNGPEAATRVIALVP